MHPVAMMLSFLLLLSCHSSLAAVLPDGTEVTDPDFSKYDPNELLWFGTVGGHYIEHQGTLETLLDRVEEEHPDFNRQSLIPTNSSSTTTAGNVKARQDTFDPDYTGRLCCPVAGQPFNWAPSYLIKNQVNYLNALNLGVWAPRGPGACRWATCSLGFGIKLCNDFWLDPIYLSSKQVANEAYAIVLYCPNFNHLYSCGQQFDADFSYQWNVIVSNGC